MGNFDDIVPVDLVSLNIPCYSMTIIRRLKNQRAFNPSRKRFTIAAEPDSAAIARLDQLADSDGKATSTSPRSSEVDMAMLAALERLNQQLTSLETRVDKWQKESTAQFTELSKTVKTLATRK